MTRDRIVLLASGLLVLLALNALILEKEGLKKHGQTMLLELGSRDPRSLFQGDYMELFYRVEPELQAELLAGPHQGHVVVRCHARNVAQVVRRHAGETLAAGEHLLTYRQDRRRVRFGSDAFFFQEGQADLYAAARYGELRVDGDGDSLLVGLRGSDLQPLGPGK